MDASKEISRDLLEGLFEDATWAPTHGMNEPWHFVVFSGGARQQLAGMLQKIYQEVTPGGSFRPEKFEKLGKNPLMAHTVAAVCMRRHPAGKKIPEVEDVAAVACGVQNLQLSAASIGLGVFWSSPPLVYSDAMRSYLGLGDDDKCLGLLYIGWPRDSTAWPGGVRRPVSEKVVWIRD